MPAPKGHPLWGNPLKPKKYTPEELWGKSVEYFEFCDKNPWQKKELIKSGDLAGTCVDVPTQKPYTKQGLCVWLNISFQTLKNYEGAKGYETYFEVVEHINNIIKQNQLEGATVGAYNSSIISQLLGLNKQSLDVTTGGEKLKNVIVVGGKEIEI